MSGINKVILIGHLGKDPELRYLDGGVSVTSFPLATSEVFTKDGQKVEMTEWHNIVVWGKQAEIAEKFLRKGKQVLIEGRIQYREYTDQAGVKKTACDIRCDNFQMLGRMDEGGGGSRESYGGSRGGGMDYEESAPAAPSASGGYDDDIPF